MFAKALILVLLGSSLVVSSPVAEPGKWWDKAKEWVHSATSAAEGAYQSGLNTVSALYENTKANIASTTKLGEDAAAYLQQEAVKAKDAALAKIEDINAATKAKIQQAAETAKTTGKVVGYEAEKIAKAGQDQINQVIKAMNQEIQDAKDYYANKEAQKP